MTTAKLEIRKGDNLLEELIIIETPSGLEDSKGRFYPTKSAEAVRDELAESIAMRPPSKDYKDAKVKLIPERQENYSAPYF
jgi:hypothetical protein